MNWIVRFGEWWESRRVLRKPDFNRLKDVIAFFKSELDQKIDLLKNENSCAVFELKDALSIQRLALEDVKMSLVTIRDTLLSLRKDRDEHRKIILSNATQFDGRITAIEKSPKIPETIAKDVALITARLERLELYVGLKRDPAAVPVKDAARIS